MKTDQTLGRFAVIIPTEYDERGERKYNKKLKYKVTVTVYIYTVNVASLHIYTGNTQSDAGEF